MKLLEEYFNIQRQLFDYFGYKEDWVTIPLDDNTESYWMLFQDERGGGSYVFAEQPFTEELITCGNIYSGSIYTQRFLPKWVYRGEEYTMVCADTHTDGNKYLMIFDNAKECRDEAMKECYANSWGTIF